MTGSPIHRIWSGIITRCYNEKCRIYRWYGGRGIKVCDRWRDFINFYEDMGNRPNGLQVDRIDNDQGYSPDNCRWVTPRENNPFIKNPPIDQMPGKIFGKWTVKEFSHVAKAQRYYICRCDCGYEGIRCGSDLRRGGSTQCRSCKDSDHRIKHKGWLLRKKEANNGTKGRNNNQIE